MDSLSLAGRLFDRVTYDAIMVTLRSNSPGDRDEFGRWFNGREEKKCRPCLAQAKKVCKVEGGKYICATCSSGHVRCSFLDEWKRYLVCKEHALSFEEFDAAMSVVKTSSSRRTSKSKESSSRGAGVTLQVPPSSSTPLASSSARSTRSSRRKLPPSPAVPSSSSGRVSRSGQPLVTAFSSTPSVSPPKSRRKRAHSAGHDSSSAEVETPTPVTVFKRVRHESPRRTTPPLAAPSLPVLNESGEQDDNVSDVSASATYPEELARLTGRLGVSEEENRRMRETVRHLEDEVSQMRERNWKFVERENLVAAAELLLSTPLREEFGDFPVGLVSPFILKDLGSWVAIRELVAAIRQPEKEDKSDDELMIRRSGEVATELANGQIRFLEQWLVTLLPQLNEFLKSEVIGQSPQQDVHMLERFIAAATAERTRLVEKRRADQYAELERIKEENRRQQVEEAKRQQLAQALEQRRRLEEERRVLDDNIHALGGDSVVDPLFQAGSSPQVTLPAGSRNTKGTVGVDKGKGKEIEADILGVD